MGQIPVCLACLSCNSVFSDCCSWITSALVEGALDARCIHVPFPSVHCLEENERWMFGRVWILIMWIRCWGILGWKDDVQDLLVTALFVARHLFWGRWWRGNSNLQSCYIQCCDACTLTQTRVYENNRNCVLINNYYVISVCPSSLHFSREHYFWLYNCYTPSYTHSWKYHDWWTCFELCVWRRGTQIHRCLLLLSESYLDLLCLFSVADCVWS